MDFEFDKEIDAILRKARGDDAAALPGAHLDADEIAAFAENALPAAARQRYTAHFADCARCRKILSNVFVYNAEADAETASAVVSAPSAAERVPWYRKLFAFPQAAYAMGAMVLLLGGFFGYLILQNLPGTQNSEVSYSANTAAPARPSAAASNSNTASTANATTNATTTNSTAMNTNTSGAAQQDAVSAANAARIAPSNTSPAAATPAQITPAQPQTTNPVAEVQPLPTPAPKPQEKDDEADRNLAKVAPASPSISRDNPNASGATLQRNERSKEESYSADGTSDNKAPADKSSRATQNTPKKKASASGAGEQRSVGGKIFNNIGGIWFDAAVGKQKQKTVRRGTSEYQKLDAGLRSIADQLGGTVVVLWGGKVYRIQ